MGWGPAPCPRSATSAHAAGRRAEMGGCGAETKGVSCCDFGGSVSSGTNRYWGEVGAAAAVLMVLLKLHGDWSEVLTPVHLLPGVLLLRLLVSLLLRRMA